MGYIPIYYKTMYDLHPWPTDFMTKIDGAIKKLHQTKGFENTCASEISYAFNCVPGHIINTWGDYGKGGALVKKVRTAMDSEGYEYIFSTLDLRQYLSNRYGSPEYFPNTSKLKDRNGLIIFEPQKVDSEGRKAMGHTDVWTDGSVDNPSLYIPSWYERVKNDVCYFWDFSK